MLFVYDFTKSKRRNVNITFVMELSPVYFGDKVIRAVLSGIQQSKDNVTGFLFGAKQDDQLYVHGCAVSSREFHDKLDDELDRITQCLPGGLQGCGMFFKTTQADSGKAVKTVCQRIFKKNSALKEGFGLGQLLILAVDQATSKCCYYCLVVETEDLKPVEVEPVNDSIFSTSFVVFRLCAGLTFSFEHLEQNAGQLNHLLGEVQYLEDRVTSDVTVFRIMDCSVQPLIYNTAANDERSSVTVSDLLDSCPPQWIGDVKSHVGAKKSVSLENSQRLVDVRMGILSTTQPDSDYWTSCAPVIHHEHKQFQQTKLALPLDVLAYAGLHLPICSLPPLFTEGIVRQLRAMVHCLVMYSQDGQYDIPKPFHFSPPELHHMITAIYPDGFSESSLESARRRLHEQFLIATKRPVFRKANSYQFVDKQSCSGTCITDVHYGLNSSTVPGGKVYKVNGHCAYHHYMQDGYDDNGWGCAYRSLQTIVSWLRLQAYTDKCIPSHTDIQQALVAVGDKPGDFVGSKKWIGSTEVSYVLDHLYGVSCKIVHVPSGGEMATKARELARHFETQGTPVMIGGGVLAHTILGVDWNEATGDVKFLILDPHYTGADELRTIQDKGWCGWKNVDFWDKSAYYNMCLPQRPNVF